MMTVHWMEPVVTGAPPVESVPAPDDARVAVPSPVPCTLQTNDRVAPAGMSCGSGADTTVTMAGATRGSNCTRRALDPPSLVTSTEISNVGPTGWLRGAVRFPIVR